MDQNIPLTHVALFKGREIRKKFYNKEWWFVVNDVVEALSEAADVIDYVKKMRLRDEELSKGWGQIVTPPSFTFPTDIGIVRKQFALCT